MVVLQRALSLRSSPLHHSVSLFPFQDSRLRTREFPVVSFATAAYDLAGSMVKAVRIHEHGGPEVLKYEDVVVDSPGVGEIKVKQTAIGLNFIDIYFRKGIYKPASLPHIIGMEGVGVVTEVGVGVTDFKLGDRVGYAGVSGAYAEERLIAADKVVPIPPNVSDEIAAALLLKGMTAQALVRRVFKVEAGHIVLVHAAAGGVGSLLCNWASALGATVIGTVSTEEKAELAKSHGCHYPILYTKENFLDRVKEITGGKGVNVVYDSVGQETFKRSLECLAIRGYLVSYGQSSGIITDPITPGILASKSLFLTRPVLMSYTATKEELLQTAEETFEALNSGVLRQADPVKFALKDSDQAHSALESRRTTGSCILLP